MTDLPIIVFACFDIYPSLILFKSLLWLINWHCTCASEINYLCLCLKKMFIIAVIQGYKSLPPGVVYTPWQICHGCPGYQWCSLTCEYPRKFFKTFEMTHLLFLEDDLWKNLKQKILWHLGTFPLAFTPSAWAFLLWPRNRIWLRGLYLLTYVLLVKFFFVNNLTKLSLGWDKFPIKSCIWSHTTLSFLLSALCIWSVKRSL